MRGIDRLGFESGGVRESWYLAFIEGNKDWPQTFLIVGLRLARALTQEPPTTVSQLLTTCLSPQQYDAMLVVMDDEHLPRNILLDEDQRSVERRYQFWEQARRMAGAFAEFVWKVIEPPETHTPLRDMSAEDFVTALTRMQGIFTTLVHSLKTEDCQYLIRRYKGVAQQTAGMLFEEKYSILLPFQEKMLVLLFEAMKEQYPDLARRIDQLDFRQIIAPDKAYDA